MHIAGATGMGEAEDKNKGPDLERILAFNSKIPKLLDEIADLAWMHTEVAKLVGEYNKMGHEYFEAQQKLAETEKNLAIANEGFEKLRQDYNGAVSEKEKLEMDGMEKTTSINILTERIENLGVSLDESNRSIMGITDDLQKEKTRAEELALKIKGYESIIQGVGAVAEKQEQLDNKFGDLVKHLMKNVEDTLQLEQENRELRDKIKEYEGLPVIEIESEKKAKQIANAPLSLADAFDYVVMNVCREFEIKTEDDAEKIAIKMTEHVIKFTKGEKISRKFYKKMSEIGMAESIVIKYLQELREMPDNRGISDENFFDTLYLPVAESCAAFYEMKKDNNFGRMDILRNKFGKFVKQNFDMLEKVNVPKANEQPDED